MSLAERANQGAPKIQRGPSCATCQILLTLPDSERDALVEMMHPESGWTAKAIHGALVDEGIETPGFKSIERHRRGDCGAADSACDRTSVVPAPPRIRRVA